MLRGLKRWETSVNTSSGHSSYTNLESPWYISRCLNFKTANCKTQSLIIKQLIKSLL